MRSAFLLSLLSVVVLGLFGLARSTEPADDRQAEENTSDEEQTLFVG